MRPVHRIKKQVVELELPNDQFNSTEYKAMARRVSKIFEELVDEKYPDIFNDRWSRITHLELDLGELDIAEFSAIEPLVLKQRVEKEIDERLWPLLEANQRESEILDQNNDAQKAQTDYLVKEEAKNDSHLNAEAFVTFLKTGQFPWWARKKGTDILKENQPVRFLQLQAVIKQNPLLLSRLLNHYQDTQLMNWLATDIPFQGQDMISFLLQRVAKWSGDLSIRQVIWQTIFVKQYDYSNAELLLETIARTLWKEYPLAESYFYVKLQKEHTVPAVVWKNIFDKHRKQNPKDAGDILWNDWSYHQIQTYLNNKPSAIADLEKALDAASVLEKISKVVEVNTLSSIKSIFNQQSDQIQRRRILALLYSDEIKNLNSEELLHKIRLMAKKDLNSASAFEKISKVVEANTLTSIKSIFDQQSDQTLRRRILELLFSDEIKYLNTEGLLEKIYVMVGKPAGNQKDIRYESLISKLEVIFQQNELSVDSLKEALKLLQQMNEWTAYPGLNKLVADVLPIFNHRTHHFERQEKGIDSRGAGELAILLKEVNQQFTYGNIPFSNQSEWQTIESQLVKLYQLPYKEKNQVNPLPDVSKQLTFLRQWQNTLSTNRESRQVLDQLLQFLSQYKHMSKESTWVQLRQEGSWLVQEAKRQLKKEPVVKKQKAQTQTEQMEDRMYLSNAGMVILWAFISRLFDNLDWLKNNEFIVAEKQERAIMLLYYVCTGQSETIESELLMHKILVGWPLEEPCAVEIVLSEDEKETVDELLAAVQAYNPMLKNSTLDAFRGNFLIRGGALSQLPDSWQLHVETKPYDVILKQFPWTWSTVKTPWMDKPMMVEWR